MKMIMLQQCSHSPQDIGKLKEHKAKELSQGNLLTLFCVLYVDDGAFPFEERLQLELGLSLIHNNFVKFGLEMHIGRGNKASKTKCIFFPPPVFFSTKENIIMRDQWWEYGEHKKISTSQGGVHEKNANKKRVYISHLQKQNR